MRPRIARFYAFAMNEFHFRRISFTMHKTQHSAEGAAYRHSGQARRSKRRDENGAATAADDLYGQIIAGYEGFVAWCAQCNYRIDWDRREILYQAPEPITEDQLTEKRRQDKPDPMNAKELDAMDPTRIKKNPVRLFARIPEPLRKELITRAKTKKVSLNSFVTHALVEFLKKH